MTEKDWEFLDTNRFDIEGMRSRDLIKDISQALLDGYQIEAPAEALRRALDCERRKDHDKAVFWAEVFLELRKGATP